MKNRKKLYYRIITKQIQLKAMQEKNKTPEQKLREACYKYLEEYISKHSDLANYASHIKSKFGKGWAEGVVRQNKVDCKYNKQIALSVLRLIESLRNPSNSTCEICEIDPYRGQKFSDEETE